MLFIGIIAIFADTGWRRDGNPCLAYGDFVLMSLNRAMFNLDLDSVLRNCFRRFHASIAGSVLFLGRVNVEPEAMINTIINVNVAWNIGSPERSTKFSTSVMGIPRSFSTKVP